MTKLDNDIITFSILKGELKDRGWSIREWDYPLGYIELDYTELKDDDSKLIFMRNSLIRDEWNANIWKVVQIKMSPAFVGMTDEEVKLIVDLLSALRLCGDQFIDYDSLLECDHDKIENRLEYVNNLYHGINY